MHDEPHIPRGYMEETDCRECGKPVEDSIYIGIRAPALPSPEAADGPRAAYSDDVEKALDKLGL